jgi:hypothetical protein
LLPSPDRSGPAARAPLEERGLVAGRLGGSCAALGNPAGSAGDTLALTPGGGP